MFVEKGGKIKEHETVEGYREEEGLDISTKKITIIAVAAVAGLLLIFIGIFLFLLKSKKEPISSGQNPPKTEMPEIKTLPDIGDNPDANQPGGSGDSGDVDLEKVMFGDYYESAALPADFKPFVATDDTDLQFFFN